MRSQAPRVIELRKLSTINDSKFPITIPIFPKVSPMACIILLKIDVKKIPSEATTLYQNDATTSPARFGRRMIAPIIRRLRCERGQVKPMLQA